MMRSLLLLAFVASSAAAHEARTMPGVGHGDALITRAGRVVTAPGALGDGPGTFYLDDGQHGVRVRPAPGRLRLAVGDSVQVRGHWHPMDGLATLDLAAVTRVRAARRLPEPVHARPADWEAVEGRLVTLEGVVTGHSRVPAGDALSLAADGEVVVAFVFADRLGDRIDLAAFEPGDRLRVTGVAGQFDRTAPYDEGLQIYPRSADDLAHSGVSPDAYRRTALAGLALLVLALLWAAALRRQAERHLVALRGSEDRYRRLVDRASDAVLVHHLDGRTVEMNRAAWDALGRTPTAEPPALTHIVDPDAASTLQTHLAALAAAGHARSDLALRRASGETVLFEFESAVLTLDGGTRVLSMARDVDARRAHERALESARAVAEESARLKSAFLASMSHEIRTPLTAVIGFAELLAEEVPDAQREMAEAIAGGGRRLLATLNSVLDLARLDAGRQSLALRPLDVADALRRGTDLLRPLAERRGLALTYEGPASFVVPADEGALDRVLVNLLGNALKFTEHGGVTVTLAPTDDALVLAVADTGIGMDAAFLPHVFSEFRQESEGERRSHEGSGLGLAITRRLVELMNGTITVTSERGAGTTFTVRLPLAGDALPASADERAGDYASASVAATSVR